MRSLVCRHYYIRTQTNDPAVHCACRCERIVNMCAEVRHLRVDRPAGESNQLILEGVTRLIAGECFVHWLGYEQQWHSWLWRVPWTLHPARTRWAKILCIQQQKERARHSYHFKSGPVARECVSGVSQSGPIACECAKWSQGSDSRGWNQTLIPISLTPHWQVECTPHWIWTWTQMLWRSFMYM